MSNIKPTPGFDDENLDDEENITDDTGSADEPENLNYNADEDSFEIDVKSDDPDYDHPDPYNTAVKDGGDSISTYDESNPLATDEYIKDESLETDVDHLGMHISNGEDLEMDPIDDILSRTPEDDRDDLDEEGYPKNDRPMK
ncbi:hypothetical protein BEL04_17685 [Mucilaginibacter sp. PPCGB 2223]|uniref:hypothetical protein n=1 Tax=Mucilaginibacter sp. PPCGB 2223 TaxID=1886027 RepID=UPI00082415FB|nr:hypothetical protein [Mucilaginibacter sp. PPCGB 2223]OCX51842.1 hypothetical protein BEL04_17685 [Mucilaginibacter sp. PPCGB 2223]